MSKRRKDTDIVGDKHSFVIQVACILKKVEKAILLKEINGWCVVNKKKEQNIYFGFAWTYNSVRGYEDIFKYMPKSNINRWLNELERDGWIFSSNFNKRKNDKTKWYTANLERYNDAVLNKEWTEKQIISWVKFMKKATKGKVSQSGIDMSQNGTGVSQSGTGISQNGTTLPSGTTPLTPPIEAANEFAEPKGKEIFATVPGLKTKVGPKHYGVLNAIAQDEKIYKQFRDLYQDGRFELLTDWLEYKKEKRSHLSSRGIKLLLTDISNHTPKEVETGIKNSILNGYTGLFLKEIRSERKTIAQSIDDNLKNLFGKKPAMI